MKKQTIKNSLKQINNILNTNTKSLNHFGQKLFDIAKKTEQSFDDVTQRATEFARKGIKIDEQNYDS